MKEAGEKSSEINVCRTLEAWTFIKKLTSIGMALTHLKVVKTFDAETWAQ